jgi:hypothetical protein
VKATIVSTDQIVRVEKQVARVWEGVSEKGVPFVAYVTMVQVRASADQKEFERELVHKPADRWTLQAIDLRLII